MTPNSALNLLAEQRDDINRHLADYFASQAALLGVDLPAHSQAAFAKLQEFTERPGKRIRGALAQYSYQLFGGKKAQTGLDLAVAIELVQNYLLIVDDVMDRSPTRRGGPTVHVQYTKDLAQSQSPESATHIGNMLAVHVGILALHMASDLLARSDEDGDNVLLATSAFQRNIAATAYGQIEDLYNDSLHDTNEVQLSQIHALKNSYYTFINPLQVGALLAGQQGEVEEEIINFGLPAGIAFQLRDDIIGLFGNPNQTGKSDLDDLKEGKMTLLISHALNNGTEAQQAEISAALGNPKVTQAQHEKVKSIVEDIGSLAYTEKKTFEQAEQAKAALQASRHIPDDGRLFYSEIVDYVAERSE